MSESDTEISDFETVSWTVAGGTRNERPAVHLVQNKTARTFCGQAIPETVTRSANPLSALTCARCRRKALGLQALALFARSLLIKRG